MTRFLAFCTILACVLLALPVGADEVVVDFPQITSEVVEADGAITFDAPGYSTAASPGDPSLPFKTVWVLLPPNADLKSVQVSLRDEVGSELPDTYNVAPCPPLGADEADGTKISWGPGKEIVDGRNILVYGTDAFYPSANVTLGLDSRLAEFLMVPVQCWPYRYNPVTGKIVQLTGGQIVVSYSINTSIPKPKTAAGPASSERVSEIVANYQDAVDWYGAPDASRAPLQAGPPKLTVITTQAIKNASTKLTPFVTHKTNTMGIPTTVYTEGSWSGAGSTGITAAVKIRNFLKTVYSSTNDNYVLIIGDPRETSAVPMLPAAVHKVEDKLVPAFLADNFYADTTGNWDLNGDGSYGAANDFGPGGVDLANPEFSVGRIPYYGSIADLDKILQKTINFESATTVGAWAQRALIPMVPANESVTFGWQVGEGIRTDTCNSSYRAYFRLYSDYAFPDSLSAYPGTRGVIVPRPEKVPVNETNVLAEWQKGYGFVFWFTHGGPQGASGIFYSDLAPYLNDSTPAFTFQASCLNGDPTDTNNLAYALLKNGAIGTNAAPVVSLYRVSGTDGTNDPCNQGLVHHYAEFLARDKNRCGDALYLTKSYLYNYCGPDLYHNLMMFNLYGDPTVAPRWPTSYTIETPAGLPMAVRSQAYRVDLKAAGSTAPYYWSRTAGSLPSGITLSNGYLSGTPLVAGTYTFTLQCRSSSSPYEYLTREFSLVVKDTLTATPTTLPRGNVDALYNVQLVGSGGTAPYSFSTTSALPDGVTLSPSGLLRGTPTASGTFSISVLIIDGANFRAVKTYILYITRTRILTTGLPIAIGGQPYSAVLSAAGGTAPYTWSISVGQVPPGVTLTTSGLISGTPRQLGTYNLTVRAADSTGEWTNCPLSLPVLLPAYSWPLDTIPGPDLEDAWDISGSWAFGVPLGLGTLSKDPTSGHTGSNVFGYRLTGDYSNGMSLARHLTTCAIDCSDLSATHLSFWRWLGVEDADSATIDVSDGTSWNNIWSSLGQTYAETEWSQQVYSISAYADTKSGVMVRWGMGPTNVTNSYCGWNIDDIGILGIPLPTTNQGDLGLIKSVSADNTEFLVRGKVVTAVMSDGFYVQEPGKYHGLKVAWPYGGITVDRYILVHGTMQTDASTGERYLLGDCIYKDAATAPAIRPVGMTLTSLGGSLYGLQPGVADASWVSSAGGEPTMVYTAANGVNNIGCLIRTTGKVTAVYVDDGFFYIDDGSGLVDGTGQGVRVKGNLSSGDVGRMLVVTGVSTCFNQDGALMRQIIPTQAYFVDP